ncbi:S1 family peptidase [Corynebacterium silvaticum]|uniref:S1 family peptidase n=1 Tax=Corynebacterium silvaticum TaxID=2320431 RepID=A0A7U5K9S0_9CORY|nr:S1 family peptidase [Corynebacterium silvaticum]ARU46848.2 S1 family peptidase [Corynebacterium silvaticum]MBH5300759.1 S1 family peptidase [Corynebacterium silvaticum]NOM64958.1 S1 family peptidase [Corynebacterium silvaticum]NON70161.1 S1 family peptidase [Corynebacterium silvaticum]UWH00094.1 S1 family peptidase [Corynebacterium silvaticum]
MKRFNRCVASVIASAGLVMLSAPASHALEGAEAAPVNEESRSVVALSLGKAGQFGDCTGTLLNERWVISARHCFALEDPSGGKARVGQAPDTAEYDIDGWVFAPSGDIALAHLAQQVEDVSAAKLPEKEITVGAEGRLYGWSSSSKLAAEGKLPSSKISVVEIFGDAKSKQTKLAHVSIVDGGGIQPGDSGGPLFVDGKLAGVATAGAVSENPDKPAPGGFYTTVIEQKKWIEDTIKGEGEGVLQTEAADLPEDIAPKQHGGRAPWYGAGAVVLLAIIAAYSRLSNKKQGAKS